MSDEIKQVLGFDVDSALTNLDRFEKQLGSTSAALNRFGKSVSRFNGLTSSTPETLNQTAGAMTTAGNAANRSASQFGRLTTSVELLSRIVYTQLVIKGLRLTERAMIDAASRAGELEVKLADIATISGRTFNGISDIGSAVEQLSRGLGTDQLAVAEGLYEAIGNQIGGTKDELIGFNRVAGEFAGATLTSQQDAMRLLSGVLNSYQIDVSRAEEVASKFNRAIDLGSISGRDFASQFGRVAPQAAQLGVSLDEVLAAFSTLTRNGLSASESATRLLGVITGLQKPSENLTEVLGRLNATSGEGLVRSAGFAAALKEIASQTDGTSSQIAKLFPNVRGLSGQLILGGQRAEAFADDLAKITSTASTLNKERFNIVFNTDAKQVERELNILRIETTKLGKELLHATAAGFEFVGGADNIAAVAKNAAPAIAAVAAAAAIYTANTRLAALEGTKLAGVLGTLSKIGLGIGAAVTAGNFLGDRLDSGRFDDLRRITAANDATVARFITGEQSRLTAARDADAKIVQSALNASREQVNAFTAANNQLIADEKRLVSVATSELQRFIGTREGLVRGLEQAAEQSTRVVEQSQKRVTDLKLSADERKFNATVTGQNDPTKVMLQLERASTLARQASSALAKAQTDDQITAAQRLFDTAERHIAAANQLGAEVESADALKRLTNERIAAEQRLQSIHEQRQKTLAAEATKQKQLTDSIKASAKELVDNLPTMGLSPQERSQRAANRQAALQKIVAAGFNQSDMKLADALGLARLAQEMQAVPISFDTEAAVRDLTTAVQKNLDTFKFSVKFNVAGLESALGRTLTTPDEISAAFSEATQEADALRTSLSKVGQERTKALTGVKDEVRSLLDSTDSFANFLSRSLTVPQPDAQKALALIAQFKTEANALLSSPNINTAQVKDLFATVQQLGTMQDRMGGSLFGSGGGLNPDIEALSEVTGRLLQIANLPAVDPQQAARLQQLEAVINSSRDAATTIQSALTSGAATLDTVLRGAADYFASKVGASFPTALKHAGGLAYHASGGMPRGSDTIPAMLTRGETVMTAKATQRFHSDFQRMNAGMLPAYRNAGGTVNNTIGDVSIHVDGSKSPKMTAQEISRVLKRGHRKGVI